MKCLLRRRVAYASTVVFFVGTFSCGTLLDTTSMTLGTNLALFIQLAALCSSVESVKHMVVVRDSRARLYRPNEMYLVEDNVLEVVGYTPLLPGAGDQMAAHIEKGLHQQALERSQSMVGKEASDRGESKPGVPARGFKEMKDVDTVHESWGAIRQPSAPEELEQNDMRLTDMEAGDGNPSAQTMPGRDDSP